MGTAPDPQPLTLEEFERVLHADRFATVHDLVGAAGFDELRSDARATPDPDGSDAPGDGLPTRR